MLRKSEIISIKLCHNIEFKFNNIIKDLIIKKNDNFIECYKYDGNIYLDYNKKLDNLHISATAFYDLMPHMSLKFEQYVYLNKILFKEYFNIP